MSNMQAGNVGNEGDILKHAALCALAHRLQKLHPDRTITYLESNAFLRETRLANPDWAMQTDLLCRQFNGYEAYRSLQAPFATQQRYLCSVGIANSILGKAENILYEADPETGSLLGQQLQQAGDDTRLLGTDHGQLQQLPVIHPKQPLLALIDPFVQTDGLVSNALSLLAVPDAGVDTVVLLFDYRKHSNPVWPGATAAVANRAVMNRSPWHLACYWRGRNAPAFSPVLESLGWQTG